MKESTAFNYVKENLKSDLSNKEKVREYLIKNYNLSKAQARMKIAHRVHDLTHNLVKKTNKKNHLPALSSKKTIQPTPAIKLKGLSKKISEKNMTFVIL